MNKKSQAVHWMVFLIAGLIVLTVVGFWMGREAFAFEKARGRIMNMDLAVQACRFEAAKGGFNDKDGDNLPDKCDPCLGPAGDASNRISKKAGHIIANDKDEDGMPDKCESDESGENPKEIKCSYKRYFCSGEKPEWLNQCCTTDNPEEISISGTYTCAPPELKDLCP